MKNIGYQNCDIIGTGNWNSATIFIWSITFTRNCWFKCMIWNSQGLCCSGANAYQVALWFKPEWFLPPWKFDSVFNSQFQVDERMMVVLFVGEMEEVGTREVFLFWRRKNEIMDVTRSIFPWMLGNERIINEFHEDEPSFVMACQVLDAITGDCNQSWTKRAELYTACTVMWLWRYCMDPRVDAITSYGV